MNRTAARTWSTQYRGSVSSEETSPPVTFETTGIRGSPNASPSAIRPNSASIGSINAEWNA